MQFEKLHYTVCRANFQFARCNLKNCTTPCRANFQFARCDLENRTTPCGANLQFAGCDLENRTTSAGASPGNPFLSVILADSHTRNDICGVGAIWKIALQGVGRSVELRVAK